MDRVADLAFLLSDPSKDGLPQAMDCLREITGFDVVCLALSQPLTVSGPAIYGSGLDELTLCGFAAACRGAWEEWLVARATPIWVPDVSLDVRADGIGPDFPYRSILLLPIAHPEMEVRGFAALAATQRPPLDETQCSQLGVLGQAFANYAYQLYRNVQAQHQLRIYNALTDVTHLLASSLDVSTLLRLSGDVLATLAGAELYFVSIEAEVGGALEPVITRGIQRDDAAAYLELLVAGDEGPESARPVGVPANVTPYNFPLPSGGRVVGYLTLLADTPLRPETIEACETAGRLLGVAVQHGRLYSCLEKTHQDAVRALSTMLDVRDRYSYGHSLRVAELSRRLAEKLQLPPDEVARIETAALLHDVGKVAIPEAILQKRGPLSPEELAHIREHPILGAQIVGNIHGFDALAPYIRHHHERFDGNGYPHGLQGDAIPLGARIIAIAEAYDYLLSQSDGQTPTPQDVYRELADHAGTQFDSELVRAFAALVPTGGSSPLAEISATRSEPLPEGVREANDAGDSYEGPPRKGSVSDSGTAATPLGSRTPPALPAPQLAEPLTPRETEVLELVGQGLSNAEISAALEIREKTVKAHLNHIYQKLGFSDRLKAALYIREQRRQW